jgi:hypothetical protein
MQRVTHLSVFGQQEVQKKKHKSGEGEGTTMDKRKLQQFQCLGTWKRRPLFGV